MAVNNIFNPRVTFDALGASSNLTTFAVGTAATEPFTNNQLGPGGLYEFQQQQTFVQTRPLPGIASLLPAGTTSTY